MSVDGVCCDRWLDNNDGNDGIAGPSGDVGNKYGSIIVGTRVIPLFDLNLLLADGELAFLFGYNIAGGAVDNLQSGDFASVRIQFWHDHETESVNPAPVPEPSTLLLLGTGLAGVVAWRKKQGQA